MPELPDVEVFREIAEDYALRRPIETVSIRPAGMTMTTSEATIREALLGHTLTATRRWGKHLFLRSGEDRNRWLRLHFGMTGTLVPLEEDDDEPRHTRLRLDFRGGDSLAFRCPRKFGEIGLVTDPGSFAEARMAGLGNIYTDEVLFHAGLHPEAPVEELDNATLESLFDTAVDVSREAVHHLADPERMPDDWLLPRRDDGEPCPRCDGTIRRSEVNGRPTYHCGGHQGR